MKRLKIISIFNGYDLAIVLTKNSNALAKQTVDRMKQEFLPFRDDIIKYGFEVPEIEEVKSFVIKAIKYQWLNKVIVNSENDINTLLDEDGQLRLRTPLNIFIG